MSRYAGLGAAQTPAAGLVDQMNVDLVQTLVQLNLRLQKVPFYNPQLRGQLQTAVTTLNNVISGPFTRLASKAKAGDLDALQRITQITNQTLKGMNDIIKELDTGSQKNWDKLGQDILKDLEKKAQEIAEAAGAAGGKVVKSAVSGAPVVAAIGGALLLLWLLGRLK